MHHFFIYSISQKAFCQKFRFVYRFQANCFVFNYRQTNGTFSSNCLHRRRYYKLNYRSLDAQTLELKIVHEVECSTVRDWISWNECESNDMHTRATAIFQTVQLDRKCAVVHGNCNFAAYMKRACKNVVALAQKHSHKPLNLALNWNDISFREILSAVQFTALILARSVRPVRRSRNATKKGQTLSFFI